MRQPVPLRTSRSAAVLVAVAGASAVLLGAFGAHALRGVLSVSGAQWWHTASQYHFWHALALAGAVCRGGRAARAAQWLFALGIVVFCGSLYAMALGAPLWFGAITPLGGVAFTAGWIALGASLWPENERIA